MALRFTTPSSMREPGLKSVAFLLSLSLIIGGCLYVSYVPSQSDFRMIAVGGGLAWLGYGLLLSHPRTDTAYWVTAISIGLLARVVLVFAFPNLSDDIYRFVWDGRCLHHGISPYAATPSALVEQGLPGLDASLLAHLNSPDYYSVYPPVAQLLYSISSPPTWSLATSAGVLKILHLIIEAVGMLFLYRLARRLAGSRGTALRSVGAFYLCPLVIIEGSGNLHHEPMSVALLITSIYLLHCRRYVTSAVAVMLGVGIKLIPIIIVPYVLWRLEGSARRRYGLTVLAMALALAIPLIGGLDVGHFLSSIDLYFRRFEFNASIYYLARYIGEVYSGYNLIAYLGPLLALFPLVFAIKAITDHRYGLTFEDLSKYLLFTLTLYYLVATTVHPWYLINLLPFAWWFGYRYAIVWAMMAMCTYINYSYTPYEEQLWMVVIEYIVVLAVLLWEWNSRKTAKYDSLKDST